MSEDDYWDDTENHDQDNEDPPDLDWPDDTESYPVVINVYNTDGDRTGRYFTLVVEDESFDNGYIVSDVVESIAPEAEHVATKVRPEDDDDDSEDDLYD